MTTSVSGRMLHHMLAWILNSIVFALKKLNSLRKQRNIWTKMDKNFIKLSFKSLFYVDDKIKVVYENRFIAV